MQAGYITEILGRPARPLEQMPAQAKVIAREQQTIGTDEPRCNFEVVLTASAATTV